MQNFIIQNNHTVLLGSAGVGAAYASAKALRKYFKVKIVSVDINPSNLVTASLFSDTFYQIPIVDCKEFNDKILQIINEHEIDTYIPFIDHEVYKAAVLFESGKLKHDLFLQLKSSLIALTCRDKYSAFKWLRLNGFSTPDTYIIEDKKQLKDGFILKPRTGFGSKIQIISKDYDLHIENFKNIIMQEYCSLPEITIDVHYSKKFSFFEYACRERIETKSGVCTKARIFKEPSLGEMALELAKKMDLSSFCFQVMKINNEYAITDINPRLGGGTALSDAVGLDFHGAMFANLWGQNPEKYFIDLKEEKYVTRQYSEFVM